MSRNPLSRQARSRTRRSRKSQSSTNPLDCPNNLSLYERESRIAEEKLAARRKSKKRRTESEAVRSIETALRPL